jgi:hypothetical protein
MAVTASIPEAFEFRSSAKIVSDSEDDDNWSTETSREQPTSVTTDGNVMTTDGNAATTVSSEAAARSTNPVASMTSFVNGQYHLSAEIPLNTDTTVSHTIGGDSMRSESRESDASSPYLMTATVVHTSLASATRMFDRDVTGQRLTDSNQAVSTRPTVEGGTKIAIITISVLAGSLAIVFIVITAAVIVR